MNNEFAVPLHAVSAWVSTVVQPDILALGYLMISLLMPRLRTAMTKTWPSSMEKFNYYQLLE